MFRLRVTIPCLISDYKSTSRILPVCAAASAAEALEPKVIDEAPVPYCLHSRNHIPETARLDISQRHLRTSYQ